MRRVLAAVVALLPAGCVQPAPVKWPDMQAASLPHSSGGSPPYTVPTTRVDSGPGSTTPIPLLPTSIPQWASPASFPQWSPPTAQFEEVQLEEYDSKLLIGVTINDGASFSA
jgi:hypothetical protein